MNCTQCKAASDGLCRCARVVLGGIQVLRVPSWFVHMHARGEFIPSEWSIGNRIFDRDGYYRVRGGNVWVEHQGKAWVCTYVDAHLWFQCELEEHDHVCLSDTELRALQTLARVTNDHVLRDRARQRAGVYRTRQANRRAARDIRLRMRPRLSQPIEPERAEIEEVVAEMAQLEAAWAACSRPHNDCSTDRPCPGCGCGYPQEKKP